MLVVEDNDDLVNLVTKALARAGLDVDAAQTVADAEASLRTVQYAAVVLDLGLPDADGLTLLDQMRRRRDQTPVLILSARGGLDDRVGGLNKGASDYMVKPFSTDELIARGERADPHDSRRWLLDGCRQRRLTTVRLSAR